MVILNFVLAEDMEHRSMTEIFYKAMDCKHRYQCPSHKLAVKKIQERNMGTEPLRMALDVATDSLIATAVLRCM